MATKILWATFKHRFQPRRNVIIESDNLEGCLFRSFGQEEQHVRRESLTSQTIWTVLEDDGPAIIPGFHRLPNTLGFLSTKIPWKGEEDYDLLNPI